jgi:hypothetical protein
VTRAELDAIAAAVGVDLHNVHGLVTIQVGSSHDGGRMHLPTAAVGEALCQFERRHFERSSITGYRAYGVPSLHYWLRGATRCAARTADDVPGETTYFSASIPAAEVRAILERTEDLIGLARGAERCEPELRLWAQFEPRYLRSVRPRDGRYEVVLAQATDVYTGLTFVFSLADGKPKIAGKVCYENWSPLDYEDQVSEFMLP